MNEEKIGNVIMDLSFYKGSDTYSDGESVEDRILDNMADLPHMLLRSLSQLGGKVMQGTLAKEIDDTSASVLDPGKRVATVDKSQNFHLIQVSFSLGPFCNSLECFKITVGNPCGCDLDAIDLDLIQKDLGYTEFLAGSKRNSRGLFSIPKGGIHDFQFHMLTFPNAPYVQSQYSRNGGELLLSISFFIFF